MDSLWFRVPAVLVLWLTATVALFQATLGNPSFYTGGWFYVACGACGALALFIGKLDRVASLMAPPALAVASFVIVDALRLGYFGL
jgi:hypothetical protein